MDELATATTNATNDDAATALKYKTIAHRLRNVLDATQADLKEKNAQLAALKRDCLGRSLLKELSEYFLLTATSTSQSTSTPTPNKPAKVAARLTHEGRTWILLTSTSTSTDDRNNSTATATAAAEWRDEHAVLVAFPMLQHEISSCGVWTSPHDKLTINNALATAQEQLRGFRVRAEALLRQRDAELAALRQKLQQSQAVRIIGAETNGENGGFGGSSSGSGDDEATSDDLGRAGGGSGGGGGVSSDPQQVDKLLRVQLDLREREARARETVSLLTQELHSTREQLSQLLLQQQQQLLLQQGSDSTTTTTTSLDNNTTSHHNSSNITNSSSGSVSSPLVPRSGALASPAGVGAGGGLVRLVPSGSGGAADALALTAKKMEEEYTAYRRRAVGLIKSRDEQIFKLTEELSEVKSKLRSSNSNSTSSAATPSSTPSGASAGLLLMSPSGNNNNNNSGSLLARTPAAAASGAANIASPSAGLEAKWAYLRRLLVKYLSTADSSLRAPLENAMMTVAELSSADILTIKRAQEAGTAAAITTVTETAADLVTNIFGWFGAGSGGESASTMAASANVRRGGVTMGNNNGSSNNSQNSSSNDTHRQLQFTTVPR